MKLLELFSGTHSIGKVARQKGIKVISLDRDLPADIKIDIMEWDYTIYPKGYFDIITASPVCMYWSLLRNSWFGRELKAHPGQIFTRELLEQDIEDYGIPMVDKVFEILDYFNPKYFWIENPQSSRMKEYINDLIPFYDVDYCQYGFDYRKRTRFWTNIEGFEPRVCDGKTCHAIISNTKQHSRVLGNGYVMIDGKKILCNTKELRIKYVHKQNCGNSKQARFARKNRLSTDGIGGGTNRLERYRIPPLLIEELLDKCV